MFARNILGDQLHWPRAIQGNHCNEVVNYVWLEFFKIALHSVGSELKYSDCVAPGEQLERFFILKREVSDVDFDPFCFADNAQRIL